MALVLKRSPGQSFLVGDALVTILADRRGHVLIKIDAPLDVRILRSELLSRTSGETETHESKCLD